MKFNLSARAVWAASKIQARQDMRYYLNGMKVEPIPGGGAIIIATDGHRLIVIKDAKGEIDCEAIISFDRSSNVLTRFGADRVVSTSEEGIAKITGDFAKFARIRTRKTVKPVVGVLSYEVIDGPFPNVRKIIPEKAEALQNFSCNWRYLADFGAVMASRPFNGLDFYLTGDGKSIVVRPDNQPEGLEMFGIVMPMRMRHKALTEFYPAWMGEREPAKKEAAA